MTVRRDLDQCQREGRLRRCHGGATIISEAVAELAYEQKLNVHMDAKRALARLAGSIVRPGMTVFLDAGTTTACVAEELVNISDLTVITNDLKIAQILLPTDVELVIPGGYVQKQTGSMLGSLTLEQLRDLRADVAFVGAACIDERMDTLTPTQEKVLLKREIRRMSQKCYLIADASKFHRYAIYRIDPLSIYDGVITNAALTDEEKQLLGSKTRLIQP